MPRILFSMPLHDLPEDLQAALTPLFDPSHVFSLAHRLQGNGELLEKLLNLVSSDARLPGLMADEAALLQFLKEEKHYEPSVNDRRIRHCLWVEFENAIAENRRMTLRNVHSLVCDEKSFYRLFVQHAPRAAFLLCRPTGYREQLNEMLSHGLSRMRAILDLPEVDARGKLNTKLLDLKAKIYAMTDLRLHGAPTQKIQQLNLNMNADAQGRAALGDVRALAAKGDMATIQKRIGEIEKEIKKSEGAAVPEPLTIEVKRDG